MANLTFTTSFDLQSVTKQIVIYDITDYAGQGISVLDVNGCLTVTAPSGTVIYNNSDFSNLNCDVYIDSSNVSQQLIPIPLGSDGMPESGTYTLLYTVYDTNLSVYYTKTNTYDYVYVRPVVDITQTADCISPAFVSTDSTNYVVDNITPTIVRDHQLLYPNGSDGQGIPTVTTGVTITRGAGQFYAGVQTTTIESDLTYVFTDGLTILDTIEGYQNFTVSCIDICGINCCLNTLEARMESERCSNSALYKVTSALFSQVMGLVGLIKLNIECGNGDNVSSMLDTIKELTNCTDACNDCSGDPNAPIVGLGTVLNNVVVQSGGSPVIVTSVVSGNLTTYTVTLSSSFVNSVNSFYNTRIVKGTTGYTVVYDGIVSGLRQYTVGLIETVVAAGANVTSVTDSGIVAGVRTFTVNVPAALASAQKIKNFSSTGDGDILIVTDAELTAVFGSTARTSLIVDVWRLIGGVWTNITTLDAPGEKVDVTISAGNDIEVTLNFPDTGIAYPYRVVITGASPIASPNFSTSETNIVAFPTGGQLNATQLSSEYNKVTVCASPGDSVKAFPATVGARMEVDNKGAEDLYLYPMLGENFETYPANSPFVIVSGAYIVAFCYSNGEWSF